MCLAVAIPYLCVNGFASNGILDSSAGSDYSLLPASDRPSPLKFNSDGRFKIIYLCDIQDVYPMDAAAKEFICEVLDNESPDLVILGGDNTVAPKEDKSDAIAELCGIFTSREIYFTLVFGNHDHEQGLCDDELLQIYAEKGGEYCLAYDQNPALTGTATHHLTVAASDSAKPAFNLWMFDSNEYEGKGDGSVNTDQVEWYSAKSAEFTRLNGGEPVPAMAFQHIVMRNVQDKLFFRLPLSDDDDAATVRNYEDCSYSLYLRKFTAYSGFIHEMPCAGYYDHGELDAMVRAGDVMAVFSGHDHICDYRTTVSGIEIINTPGCSHHAYGKDIMRGCRRIVISEDDPLNYETETITFVSYAAKKDSVLPGLDGITRVHAIAVLAQRNVLKLLHDALNALNFLKIFDRF